MFFFFFFRCFSKCQPTPPEWARESKGKRSTETPTVPHTQGANYMHEIVVFVILAKWMRMNLCFTWKLENIKERRNKRTKKSWRKFVSNVWENLLCSIYMVTRSELIDEPFSVERVRWIFILYILQQQLATINMAFKRRPFLYSFLSLVRFCLVLGELDKLGHWN